MVVKVELVGLVNLELGLVELVEQQVVVQVALELEVQYWMRKHLE